MNNIREKKTFTEGVKLSSQRLGFSVTKACPLRCGHCSVSADPNLKHTTFPVSFTDKILNELSDISKAGIHYIDFTGGEPLLAKDFVSRISKRAKDFKIKTGVVTAAHWATTKESAKRTLESFCDIDEWDISTDLYHLEFVSINNIINAYDTLKNNFNKQPIIRVAYHVPFTKEDCELIIELDKLFGKNIGFQPIGPVGRAHEFVSALQSTLDDYDKSPCPSTGLLIQPFGTAVSCCAPLSHEDYDHPLRLGNAFTEPMVDLINNWRTNALLQTIRMWGFEPIIKWLKNSGYPVEMILKDQACQTCVSLIQSKEACQIAFKKANEFKHKLSLAISLKEHFNENYFEDEIKEEAQNLLKKLEYEQ